MGLFDCQCFLYGNTACNYTHTKLLENEMAKNERQCETGLPKMGRLALMIDESNIYFLKNILGILSLRQES